MSDAGEKQQSENVTANRSRGPAYPYIDLPKALSLLDKLVAAKLTNKHPVSPQAIYGFWGLGVKSSSARQSLAALKYYGLVEYSGSGKDRRVRLTDRAMILGHDKDATSSRRIKALKDAALSPAIFREVYEEQNGPFLPAEPALGLHLTLEKGFDKDSADRAVSHFLNSIRLAGLDKPDNEPDGSEENDSDGDEDGVTYGGASVGDFVQWESQGALRLEKPARVTDISPDGNYVAVEGHDAWVPMSETIVEPQAKGDLPPPPPFPGVTSTPQIQHQELPADTKQDTFATTDGDVVLRWPVNLSADSLEDVEAWTALILKKVKREIARRDAEDAELE